MGALAAIEHFLERLFERQSARLFKTAIRPIQVQRRLERAMEERRNRDGGRTIVPHRFRVRLQPDDLAALRKLVSLGLEGAIVGKALYAGAFTLEQALDVAGRP